MRATDRGGSTQMGESISGPAGTGEGRESDSGRPVSAVRRQDMPAVLDTLTYYAGMADKINGQVIPTRNDALTYTLREPLGVVGAIIPWNFPLMIGMWKIAPALACGCTVVLKPAEMTPLTALDSANGAAGRISSRRPQCRPGHRQKRGRGAGPSSRRRQGDLHRLAGGGPSHPARCRGQSQARDARVGRQVGHIIFRRRSGRRGQSGERRHLLQQRPGVPRVRILVHRDVYEQVVERLAARARSIRMGDPRDAATTMGPLVSSVQMQRVLDYIEIGRREGATVVTGGGRGGEHRLLRQPDGVPGVTPGMRLPRRKFGPVAAVIQFRNTTMPSENRQWHGLKPRRGRLDRDITRVHQFTRRLKAGTCG